MFHEIRLDMELVFKIRPVHARFLSNKNTRTPCCAKIASPSPRAFITFISHSSFHFVRNYSVHFAISASSFHQFPVPRGRLRFFRVSTNICHHTFSTLLCSRGGLCRDIRMNWSHNADMEK